MVKTYLPEHFNQEKEMTTSIYVAQIGNKEAWEYPRVLNSLKEAKNYILAHIEPKSHIDTSNLTLELNKLNDITDPGGVEVTLKTHDWYKISKYKSDIFTEFIAKAEKTFKALEIESDSDLESLSTAAYSELDALLEEFLELRQKLVIAQCEHRTQLWWYSYSKSSYKDILKYFF